MLRHQRLKPGRNESRTGKRGRHDIRDTGDLPESNDRRIRPLVDPVNAEQQTPAQDDHDQQPTNPATGLRQLREIDGHRACLRMGDGSAQLLDAQVHLHVADLDGLAIGGYPLLDAVSTGFRAD